MADITPVDPKCVAIAVGDNISFPFHQLRVIATEFPRNPFFPDCVAQVEVVFGGYSAGSFLRTPFGLVELVKDSRPASVAAALEGAAAPDGTLPDMIE